MASISSTALYNDYISLMQQIADVKYAAAVLQWDQETYLPEKGNAARSRQLATLSETAHRLFSEEGLGELLHTLQQRDDLDEKQRTNIRLTLEDYTKQKKYTGSFVRRLSEAVSAAFHAWIEARRKNDFGVFEPALSVLLELKKQESDILGYEDHPYNAHLKEYEKSADTRQLDALFESLKAPLKDLIGLLVSRQPDTGFLRFHYPKHKQWEYSLYLIKKLGFDTAAGRQDVSEHPFTTSFSAKDVRITTRIDEHDLANIIWSCIHETGHALYEQGLPDEDYGLPSGEYASLSIHESQSRLWENCIGRSAYFWQQELPVLKTYFPQQLNQVDLSRFVASINKVTPSLIRTEADELTYHFHVMIRYTIEKELLSGMLLVKDIPGRWNDLYRDLLGVNVPDHRQGCLQDVHWSHGSFGYFPTYSLGSLYAAQFWWQLQQDEPGIRQQIASGSLDAVHRWLQQKVYAQGRLHTSGEFCQQITGQPLHARYFMEYVKEKYGV